MELLFHLRRISVLSKSGWRIVISRMRGLSVNWKELQHTGVCSRNIHLNTSLLTRYIAPPRTRLRNFAPSRFAAQSRSVVDGARAGAGRASGVVRSRQPHEKSRNNNASNPRVLLFITNNHYDQSISIYVLFVTTNPSIRSFSCIAILLSGNDFCNSVITSSCTFLHNFTCTADL